MTSLTHIDYICVWNDEGTAIHLTVNNDPFMYNDVTIKVK